EPPPRVRRFFTFVVSTPWRRRLALTMASPPARISPRTSLPFLSLPSHSKTRSLMCCLVATAVAMVPPRKPFLVSGLSGRCGSLLVGDGDDFFECRDPAFHLDQS